MELPESQNWNALNFKKATASSSYNCVEVAELPDGGVAIRDSKDNGAGPVLRFTAAEWDAFKDGVYRYEF